MSRALRAVKTCIVTLALVLFVPASWAYSPLGPIPEAPKPDESKLWTTAEVNAVVDVSYVTIS
jgi:hypothetical protein